MNNPFLKFFICLLFPMASSNLFAQDTAHKNDFAVKNNTFSKTRIFIGTQIPVQFTAGFEHEFSHRITARAQVGVITKPYSGLIVDAMKTFGMDEYLARVIKKSFKSGVVIGVGPIYHFGSNYVGVYGQYIHLRGGGITPADALSVYFQKDFTKFDVTGFPVFEFSMQSNLINSGALFGHQFQMRNPRLSINGEVGLSKIVTSKNSFVSNRTLIDQTALARNLYADIDKEMRKSYWKYGFIPTFNLYLVYQL